MCEQVLKLAERAVAVLMSNRDRHSALSCDTELFETPEQSPDRHSSDQTQAQGVTEKRLEELETGLKRSREEVMAPSPELHFFTLHYA